MIEYCRLKIEYLRSAFGGSIIKNHQRTPRGESRSIINAKEILSQQAVGNYTLIDIKLTERSDIHKYSIVNIQSSFQVRASFLQKKTPIPTETELAFSFLRLIFYSNLNGAMILVPG